MTPSDLIAAYRAELARHYGADVAAATLVAYDETLEVYVVCVPWRDEHGTLQRRLVTTQCHPAAIFELMLATLRDLEVTDG